MATFYFLNTKFFQLYRISCQIVHMFTQQLGVSLTWFRSFTTTDHLTWSHHHFLFIATLFRLCCHVCTMESMTVPIRRVGWDYSHRYCTGLTSWLLVAEVCLRWRWVSLHTCMKHAMEQSISKRSRPSKRVCQGAVSSEDDNDDVSNSWDSPSPPMSNESDSHDSDADAVSCFFDYSKFK